MIVNAPIQWIGALVWATLTLLLITNSWILYQKCFPGGSIRVNSGGVLWSYLSFKALLIIIYGLNWASIFVYWRDIDSDSGSAIYNSTLSVYSAQVVVNSVWFIAFVIIESNLLALIFMLITFMLCVAWLTLYVIQSRWVAFALAVPYVIWCSLLLIIIFKLLNVFKSPTKKATRKRKKQPV